MIQDVMGDANRMMLEASDEEVLRASRHDPDLFAILVSRHEAAFLRKARTILRVEEDAEEVVQDTFTRIYLYADRYQSQEGASFTSWAYAILTRLAFTRYQKMKKLRGRTQELDPEAYERIPEEGTFVEELTIKDEVVIALAKLPEQAARVLRLQFLEGKTQEEIADIERSTIPAVKTRVHRAKKLFKQAVENDSKTHEL
ncbi:MAG: RNA polymerase sigma-70 factor, ECF subfamily [Parcubacteria bacterium C7867-004]|nr:MAG: RNA polymerase sigma-70 factor, ECF subfamily [Parcubacteria bacterium C7867-004]